jgi:hypothetical protein
MPKAEGKFSRKQKRLAAIAYVIAIAVTAGIKRGDEEGHGIK